MISDNARKKYSILKNVVMLKIFNLNYNGTI